MLTSPADTLVCDTVQIANGNPTRRMTTIVN